MVPVVIVKDGCAVGNADHPGLGEPERFNSGEMLDVVFPAVDHLRAMDLETDH
jgi:hypothetical protein